MTARLPTPGSDDGTWGDLLNTFLEVSLNADGTLRPVSLTDAGGVTSVNGVAPTNGAVTLGVSDIANLSADLAAKLAAASNLSDLANVPAARSNLGLGTAATENVDTTTADIQALGTQSAGSTGKVADAGHVHPTTGLVTIAGDETVSGAKTFDAAGTTTIGHWYGSVTTNDITVQPNSSISSSSSMFLDNTHGQVWEFFNSGTGAFGVYDKTNSQSAFNIQPASRSAEFFGTLTAGRALYPSVISLTFGTTISVDASQGNVFAVTLTASTGTIANPTNPVDGQTIKFRITQDSTGSRTVSWDTAYDFGSAGSPTLSIVANKLDIVGFEYVAALSKWVYLNAPFPQGF